jgi:hypothetical protein
MDQPALARAVSPVLQGGQRDGVERFRHGLSARGTQN